MVGQQLKVLLLLVPPVRLQLTQRTTLLRVHDGTTAGGHLLAKVADLTTTQSAQTAALTALGICLRRYQLRAHSLVAAFGDNLTVKSVLQAIETLLETKQTLLGTTANDLRTFSGSL